MALHEDRRFGAEWNRRVTPIVWTLFLPIFFTYTGLRTDIGSIHGWPGLGMVLLVLTVAFVSKFGGAYLAARFVGEEHRSALTIGVCMNTRGLMELIVLNIGKDLGLLPTDIFSMLVIMALVSTFMATPLIRWLMRGQERRATLVAGPSRRRPADRALCMISNGLMFFLVLLRARAGGLRHPPRRPPSDRSIGGRGSKPRPS